VAETTSIWLGGGSATPMGESLIFFFIIIIFTLAFWGDQTIPMPNNP
jgi:hypothetical protein